VDGTPPPVPYTYPKWGLSKNEKRRSRAEALYELETGLREEGWPSEELVYDAEHDLYRFSDGEFAFSREYANERRLHEIGAMGQFVVASGGAGLLPTR
jgi:hypothetical protein